jgi:hypothetical protein
LQNKASRYQVVFCQLIRIESRRPQNLL